MIFLLRTDIPARYAHRVESHIKPSCAALLHSAKKTSQDHAELGERMFKQTERDPTAFLDAALDVRVDPAVRILGLKAPKVLKEKATRGLLSLRVEET